MSYVKHIKCPACDTKIKINMWVDAEPTVEDIEADKRRGRLQLQLKMVLGIIGAAGTIREAEIYNRMPATSEVTTRLITLLVQDGVIYMPKPGHYRVTD